MTKKAWIVRFDMDGPSGMRGYLGRHGTDNYRAVLDVDYATKFPSKADATKTAKAVYGEKVKFDTVEIDVDPPA
jgi:hypothetical protein